MIQQRRNEASVKAMREKCPSLPTSQAGILAILLVVLGFLALVSVSLGVLNLLPIPLLDGGHLVYYFAEIMKGSPVSERTMEIGQRLGLALLLGLTFFAFYNDLNRLFTG